MRWRTLIAAALAVIAAGVVGVVILTRTHSVTPTCVVIGDANGYSLDTEQARYAAIIAATGHRDGLPDHAVTVALAAALQESKLRNLTYGDRDSVGLFQQRPSQGWGARSSLLDPVFAAHAFYSRLAKVSGWQTMAVAVAAQHVQRSAAGSAYEQWAGEARALARALTGQAPATLGCRFAGRKQAARASLMTAAAEQLGPRALTAPTSTARGWAAASWVVANADTYGVKAVTFGNMRWTNASEKWRPTNARSDAVQVETFGA